MSLGGARSKRRSGCMVASGAMVKMLCWLRNVKSVAHVTPLDDGKSRSRGDDPPTRRSFKTTFSHQWSTTPEARCRLAVVVQPGEGDAHAHGE